MSKYSDLFTHDRSFTVGVEEEYMLCHPTTGDLVPRADSILAHLYEDEQERFSYELILSEIEINTPISQSVHETMDHVRHFRRRRYWSVAVRPGSSWPCMREKGSPG